MQHTYVLSGTLIFLCALLLTTSVASASEITGILTSTGVTTQVDTGVVGTLSGTVTSAAVVSNAGGGEGGGGNGPPAGTFGTVNGGTGSLALGTVEPVSNQTAYTSVNDARDVETPTPTPASSPRSRARITGSIAATEPIAVDDTSPATFVPLVETTPLPVAENPSQLASVMSALGNGDLATWVWTLLLLALLVAASTYVYSRYSTQTSEYERFQ